MCRRLIFLGKLILKSFILLPVTVDMATVVLPSLVWQYRSSIPSALKSPTDTPEHNDTIELFSKYTTMAECDLK